MNIAIYTTGDFPYGGAPESFVRQMALGLHENNMNVEVIRWRGDKYQRENDLPIERVNYLFKKPFSREIIKIFELICLILFVPFSLAKRRFFKNEKVILLYGFEYAYIVLPFIFWSKIFGLRCYRIITDFYPNETIVPVWWKNPKLLLYNLQFKVVDKYLDGVIVLSRYLQNKCQDNGVDKENILLIPHLIDVGEKKIKLLLNQDKILIGFCGTPTIENGILDLCKAFISLSQKHTNAQLIIIGKVSEKVFIELNKIDFKKYDIQLLGFLNKETLEVELATCSILVNPRKKGIWADAGFPTKLGEYFATNKPVVATKVGDLAYYFKDKHELVFAEPDNPKSLSKSIAWLIENNQSAKLIADNGYYWAKINLDYRSNTNKIIAFLKQRIN